MPDLVYSRNAIQGPKSRQTARLLATTTFAAGLHPRNAVFHFGTYYELHITDGDVHFRRSTYPTPPMVSLVAATSSGDASYPWAYLLPWRRIVLLYTKAGADIYVTFSDDEGETFETPALMISGGTKPYGAVCPFTGTELIAAYIAASGKIQALRRYAGAAAYETPFFLKDDGGVDLLFEDDTFSFWVAYEGSARWILHCVIQSEGSTSTWHSGDDGETWTRFL